MIILDNVNSINREFKGLGSPVEIRASNILTELNIYSYTSDINKKILEKTITENTSIILSNFVSVGVTLVFECVDVNAFVEVL